MSDLARVWVCTRTNFFSHNTHVVNLYENLTTALDDNPGEWTKDSLTRLHWDQGGYLYVLEQKVVWE
jgi:hypothetical protein